MLFDGVFYIWAVGLQGWSSALQAENQPDSISERSTIGEWVHRLEHLKNGKYL